MLTTKETHFRYKDTLPESKGIEKGVPQQW